MCLFSKTFLKGIFRQEELGNEKTLWGHFGTRNRSEVECRNIASKEGPRSTYSTGFSGFCPPVEGLSGNM